MAKVSLAGRTRDASWTKSCLEPSRQGGEDFPLGGERRAEAEPRGVKAEEIGQELRWEAGRKHICKEVIGRESQDRKEVGPGPGRR